jgi:hypothetical protein
MVRKATCCFGFSSIEVSGEPTLNGVCHCDNCKRRTGSAFGWQAYFRDTQVLGKRGEFSQHRIRDEQERSFCTRCGTTLFWKSAFMPEQTGVAAGAFTDPPLPDPSLQATSDGRVEWVVLPEHWAHLS